MLMNPGEVAAEVVLRFMLEDTSARAHRQRAAGHAGDGEGQRRGGPEHDVSCEVMSDRPVIVERPMYSMYRGRALRGYPPATPSTPRRIAQGRQGGGDPSARPPNSRRLKMPRSLLMSICCIGSGLPFISSKPIMELVKQYYIFKRYSVALYRDFEGTGDHPQGGEGEDGHR